MKFFRFENARKNKKKKCNNYKLLTKAFEFSGINTIRFSKKYGNFFFLKLGKKNYFLGSKMPEKIRKKLQKVQIAKEIFQNKV